MIAAIYARKSTRQDVADDAKSVTRQIENARAFAIGKGWIVPDEHVYTDDGISGAEVGKLRGKQRMLDAIRSGRAPFKALVVQSNDRLSRRDGDEAFSELKAIDGAGGEVWFYSDGQRFTHGDLASNVTGFLKGEFAAEFRRAIAKKTSEAMEQKARAGHVTGGRAFGYDNVPVVVNGKRSHVERRVNRADAAIVIRILQLYDDGHGYTSIAKLLNDESAPCPRAQRGRPQGWSSSSVREVLRNERYAGILVYGKTKKRDSSGEIKPMSRPESSWLVTKDETLRIVPEALWSAVCAKLEIASKRYEGQPRRAARKHILTGVLKYGTCGAGYEAVTRAHGNGRKTFYGCSAFQRKGGKVCPNNATIAAERLEPAIVDALREQVLSERRIAAIVDRAARHAENATSVEQVATFRTRLKQIETEQARLVSAITQGGEIEPLTAALHARQRERDKLANEIERLAAPDPLPMNVAIFSPSGSSRFYCRC